MSDDFLLDDDTIPPADPLNFDVNTTSIKPTARRGSKTSHNDSDSAPEEVSDLESTESLQEDELSEDSLDDEENMAYYMLGGEDSIEE
jgi:hypothetical protein